jgi:hypothetical protein
MRDQLLSILYFFLNIVIDLLFIKNDIRIYWNEFHLINFKDNEFKHGGKINQSIYYHLV